MTINRDIPGAASNSQDFGDQDASHGSPEQSWILSQKTQEGRRTGKEGRKKSEFLWIFRGISWNP